jgi:hypothetical protein
LHLEHLFQRQHVSPMLHQPRVGPVITAELGEVIKRMLLIVAVTYRSQGP